MITRYFVTTDGLTVETDAPVIEIVHGWEGYTPRHDITREQAEQLQDAAGHDAATIQAAIMCSMFGCWHNFERIKNQHGGAAASVQL